MLPFQAPSPPPLLLLNETLDSVHSEGQTFPRARRTENWQLESDQVTRLWYEQNLSSAGSRRWQTTWSQSDGRTEFYFLWSPARIPYAADAGQSYFQWCIAPDEKWFMKMPAVCDVIFRDELGSAALLPAQSSFLNFVLVPFWLLFSLHEGNICSNIPWVTWFTVAPTVEAVFPVGLRSIIKCCWWEAAVA